MSIKINPVENTKLIPARIDTTKDSTLLSQEKNPEIKFQTSKANLRRLKSETSVNPSIQKIEKNQELLDLLIKYGNNPANHNPKDWSPFYYSIYVGDYEAALVLIDWVQDINTLYRKCGDGSETALDKLLLLLRTSNGSMEDKEKLLIKMLEKGAHIDYRSHKPNREQMSTNELSIFYSLETAISSHTSMNIKLWLLDRINPELINRESGLLLATAVRSGNIELSKLLISRGADPQRVLVCRQWYGNLLTASIESGDLQMVQFVFEELKVSIEIERFGNPISACIKRDSVNQGSVNILEYLLSKGIDPNECSSPLHSALQLGEENSRQTALKKEIIDLLIRYGAKF